MADSRLNIKITADNSDATRKFKNTFTELKSQVDLAIMGFDMLRDAAVKAFEMGKAGAELERTRGQLDNLTASIGSNSDALLSRMREASSGMMSNAEMIESATQIISLGLADNEDDVIRLATIVSELGWDMQQVILTFANNSTMRLDALGLSVQDVTKRAKELEEQGFDADKAFDLAVMDAAEEKIGLVGSAAETAAGQYKIMEANTKNLNDEMKKLANTALLPVVSALNDQVDAAKLAKQAFDLGLISAEDYRAAALGIASSQDVQREAQERATEAMEIFNLEADRERDKLLELGGVLRPTAEDTEWLTNATELYGSAAIYAKQGMESIGTAATNAAPGIEELADATRQLGETNQGVLDFIQSTIDAIISYADPEFLQAKLILESLIGLWEQGEIPLDTLGILASDLQTTLQEGEPVMDSAAANFLELKNNAGGAADETDRLNRILSTVAGDYYVRLFVEQIGDISLDASSGGIDIGDVGGLGGLPPGQTDLQGPGGASGMNFIVPPGFPNDSFPMRVQSGEHVQVTPAGQVGLGGEGSTFIVMLDGEQIAARVLSSAGSQFRQTRANGGGYVGR